MRATRVLSPGWELFFVQKTTKMWQNLSDSFGILFFIENPPPPCGPTCLFKPLSQKNCRTKSPRIFFPNSAPNFAMKVPRIFDDLSCFVFWETDNIKIHQNIPGSFQNQIPAQIRKPFHNKFIWKKRDVLRTRCKKNVLLNPFSGTMQRQKAS